MTDSEQVTTRFVLLYIGNLFHFFLNFSSSWVEMSLHVEFELPGLPSSCSSN